MKRLVVATFTGAMSISAIAFGGMGEMFNTGEVGSFAYERIQIGGKSCIYDYKKSSRRSILRVTPNDECPVTVTDKDSLVLLHLKFDLLYRSPYLCG